MKDLKQRIIRVGVLVVIIPLYAFIAGGRKHFWDAIPRLMGVLVLVLVLTLSQRKLTKTALRRGWTTEAKLRLAEEARQYPYTQSPGLASKVIILACGGPMFAIWCFLETTPGTPPKTIISTARVDHAYWFMWAAAIAAAIVNLRLGLRWVRSSNGRVAHVIFVVIVSSLFFAIALLDRADLNLLVPAWAFLTIFFPCAYLLCLRHHYIKRRFLAEREISVSGATPGP